LVKRNLFFISILIFLIVSLGARSFIWCKTTLHKKEIEKVLIQELNNYVVKCGEGYIVKFNNKFHTFSQEIYQFKEFTLTTQESTADSDRLNGIEWKGHIKINFEGPGREYSPYAKIWTDWRENINIPDPILYGEKGMNMPWRFGTNMDIITCSDIPDSINEK